VLPIQQPVGNAYKWFVLVAGRSDKEKGVGAGSGNDGSVQTCHPRPTVEDAQSLSFLMSRGAMVALLPPQLQTQDPPMPLPSSSRTRRQFQQQAPWMLTPAVPKQLPSSGVGRHQQWEWSDAL
jgi:hypothetical protein